MSAQFDEGPQSIQKLKGFGFTMTGAHTQISDKTSNIWLTTVSFVDVHTLPQSPPEPYEIGLAFLVVNNAIFMLGTEEGEEKRKIS